MGTSALMGDAQFVALLKTFDLHTPPTLSGEYGVQLQNRVRPKSAQAKQENMQ